MKKYLSFFFLFVLVSVPMIMSAQASAPLYNPNSSTVKKPVLKLGSQGPEVILWQGFLAKQNLMSSSLLTGNFGPVTKAATQNIQKLAGLTPDGVVGPSTLFFMENIMYPGLVLKYASKDTLAYLQDLYKQSKTAGVNKTKSTAKQVITNLLSVTPLVQSSSSISNNQTQNPSAASIVLSPKITLKSQSSANTNTSQLNTTNPFTTFTNNSGSKKQYSCTFTSQYTQICLPVNTSSSSLGSNLGSSGLSQSGSTSTSSGQMAQTQIGPNQPGSTSGNIGGQISAITSSIANNQSGSPVTGSSNDPLFWYCTGSNCDTLSATTTPWWQSNTTSVNYDDPNATIPLSGYPFEFKISADAIFTLYAYKLGANGKVADLQPICKNINPSVYGVPAWKKIKKCPKFTLPENYDLALVVADNGVTASAWIGTIEIAGNKYFSQDYGWRYAISNSKMSGNPKDFVSSQVINEINTNTFAPTQIIGYYGTDPWGVFIEDENDHSFDDAAWIKAVDPGLNKFAVYTLQNGGLATPAENLVVDLKANSSDSVSVMSGDNVELSWTTDDVNSCSSSSVPANSSWVGSKDKNGGTVTISNLTQKTTFNITCTGASGNTVSDSVVVDIKPTITLTSSTNADNTTKITWSSTNATSCKSTGGTTGWATTSFSRPANGSWNTAAVVAADTNFEIICKGSGGEESDSITVTATPTTPFVNFTANGSNLISIIAGNSVTLAWNSNAVSCQADEGSSPTAPSVWSGAKATSGTLLLNNLQSDTSYAFTLNCYDANNTIIGTGSVNINVYSASLQPVVVSNSANLVTSSNPNEVWYYVDWSDDVLYHGTSISNVYLTITNNLGSINASLLSPYVPESDSGQFIFKATVSGSVDKYKGAGVIHVTSGQLLGDLLNIPANLTIPTNFNF